VLNSRGEQSRRKTVRNFKLGTSEMAAAPLFLEE
jgi:hypothetical protein